MILKRLLCLSAILMTGLLLNACGQKGPLYMPDETAATDNRLSTATAQTETLPPLRLTQPHRAN